MTEWECEPVGAVEPMLALVAHFMHIFMQLPQLRPTSEPAIGSSAQIEILLVLTPQQLDAVQRLPTDAALKPSSSWPGC